MVRVLAAHLLLRSEHTCVTLLACVLLGVRFIFDGSTSPVSVISFAPVRSDLLAVANTTGSLWLINLQQQEPVVVEVRVGFAVEWVTIISLLLLQ